MYRPKKYIRLDPLVAMPKVQDCRRLLKEAEKSKGCTVELPWRSQKTYISYSLTVRVELGGVEPVWTLYEGEGNRSRVVWSSPFKDLELMNDVLHLSLPGEETGSGLGSALSTGEFEPVVETVAAAQASDINVPHPLTEEVLPAQPPGGPDFFPAAREYNDSPLPAYPSPTITSVSPPAASQSPPQPQAGAPAAPPQSAPQQPLPPYPYPPPALPPGYAYPPGYPPAYPYPPPPGYGYPGYPPAYPVDPRMQGYPQPPPQQYSPYGQPMPADPAVYRAQTVPVKQGAEPPRPDQLPLSMKPDPELMRKRPNVLLGSFLIEAGLLPETSLKAALQLQDMVKSGTLKTAQAAAAVRRAHERGGAIETHYFSASAPAADAREVRSVAPPLGSILVEAGLISGSALKAALSLQDVVRTGAMSKEDALSSFVKEHFGASEKPEAKQEREAEQVIDLLKQAGLLSDKDVHAARSVKQRHGGNISKILVAAGKLDINTFDAARTCKELMKEERLKMEQAMIALHFCQRSRMTFDEAVEELGWEQP